MQLEGQVGPIQVTDGNPTRIRTGRTGDLISSDAHSRFYESAVRGNIFSSGMTLTSIANSTFTTGTLTASCTPIIGVWNPLNTLRNLVILQVRLQIITTALARTGPGGFVWATSINQGAISTGNVPLNRFSLSASGSVAKGFANVALTGLVGSLVVQEAAGVGGGPMPVNGTDVLGVVPYNSPYVENVDGAWIIPPGGVLALLCTTTPVAISAASSIVWEETVQ